MEKFKLTPIEGGAQKKKEIKELIFEEKIEHILSSAHKYIDNAAYNAARIKRMQISGFLQFYADLKLIKPELLRKPGYRFTSQINQQIKSHINETNLMFELTADLANYKIADPDSYRISEKQGDVNILLEDNEEKMQEMFFKACKLKEKNLGAQIGADLSVIYPNFRTAIKDNKDTFNHLAEALNKKPLLLNDFPLYLRDMANLKSLFPEEFKKEAIFREDDKNEALDAIKKFKEIGNDKSLATAVNMMANLKKIEAEDFSEKPKTFFKVVK